MNQLTKLLTASALILSSIFMITSPALAMSSGPKDPGTVINTPGSDGHGTVAWANPSNAQVQDSDYATATLIVPGQTVSNYLKASNFGFDLPSDATVLGIEVNISRQASLPGIKDDVVRISKGGITGGDNKATTDLWPTAEAVASYGGASDLWGQTWTPADINSANFGLLISAKLLSSSPITDIASINNVQLSVTYSVPDTTAPDITLLGDNPVNLTVGDPAYVDAGATALDDVDGDITANIVAVNPVNTAIVGTYTVTYNVSDAAGNPATEVTRTVNVNEVPPLSSDKAITTFDFTTPAAIGVINEADHTIAATVPFGTDVTALIPTITITGVSVSPVSGVAQDFTNPVIYTVTAEDDTTQDYTVTVNVADETDTTAPSVSSYTLNGLEQSVVFNPNDPASVIIVINTDEPVKFNRIKVLNSANEEVKFFTQTADFNTTVTKTWDGKNADGVVVPDGVYTLQVNMRDNATPPNENDNLNLIPYTITVDTSVPDSEDATAPLVTSYTLNGAEQSVVFNPNDPASVTIVINTNEPVKFNRVKVLNSANVEVNFFTQATNFYTRASRKWDGKNAEGVVVPDGVYTLQVDIQDEAENSSNNLDLVPYTITVDTSVSDEANEVIAIEAGEWALISAPTLLSETPEVTDEAGGAVALLVYRNGAFVIPSAGDDELVNPLSAFFVKTTNAGEISFDFADESDSPSHVSRQLNAGWNLVGTNDDGLAVNEFATLQPEWTALYVPDTYNSRKDTGYVSWGDDGNDQFNANPILDAVPDRNLSVYDGYWIHMNAAKMFTKNID